MYVSKLNLKNFRSYENEEINFKDGVNFITGSNGAGKTNILEALSVLANIKSFRNVPDPNISKWQTEGYHISADLQESEYKRFEVGFSSKEGKVRKKFKIDESEIKKLSDYYGKLLAVVISPSDISLINGSPDIRRSFFDSVISKIDSEYLNVLSDFKKIVSNRNNLLKALREGKINNTSQLNPWDTLFAEKASFIIQRRIDFLSLFISIFNETYKKIADGDTAPLLKYINSIGCEDNASIIKKLLDVRIKDIMIGSCHVGPHRDEFLLSNENNIKFTNYGSQGQIRTAAIALKISEYKIIQRKLGKKAVILVDDIFLELDKGRRSNLVELISSGNQVIFTMVNANLVDEELFQSAKKYEINESGIREI